MVTAFNGLARQFMEVGLLMWLPGITHDHVFNVNGARGMALCLPGSLISPMVNMIYD